MSLLQILLFIPLAVVTNSLLPVPFEPVLLSFVARAPLHGGWAFAIAGGLGAAIGEALSVLVLRSLRVRAHRLRAPGWLTRGHKRFYLWAGLVACSPLPITMVRAAAFWRQPSPLWYGLSIGLGRLPRYLLLVAAWKGLAPSLGLV
jgi:membrane protein YqaA with SNARE-associated domain